LTSITPACVHTTKATPATTATTTTITATTPLTVTMKTPTVPVLSHVVGAAITQNVINATP